MRNWRPEIQSTLERMWNDGRRRAAGVILAAHRGSATDERYRSDVSAALEALGGAGPHVTYLSPWFQDPRFCRANAERILEAGGWNPGEWPGELALVFTAHSIPVAAARNTSYVEDILASCRGTARFLGAGEWRLAYQSGGGAGRVPWLGPDIIEVLREVAEAGTRRVVVQPIGFLQDHVEVMYDLDVEAAAAAEQLGVEMIRAGTVGDHPIFVDLLAGKIAAVAAACVS